MIPAVISIGCRQRGRETPALPGNRKQHRTCSVHLRRFTEQQSGGAQLHKLVLWVPQAGRYHRATPYVKVAESYLLHKTRSPGEGTKHKQGQVDLILQGQRDNVVQRKEHSLWAQTDLDSHAIFAPSYLVIFDILLYLSELNLGFLGHSKRKVCCKD